MTPWIQRSFFDKGFCEQGLVRTSTNLRSANSISGGNYNLLFFSCGHSTRLSNPYATSMWPGYPNKAVSLSHQHQAFTHSVFMSLAGLNLGVLFAVGNPALNERVNRLRVKADHLRCNSINFFEQVAIALKVGDTKLHQAGLTGTEQLAWAS